MRYRIAALALLAALSLSGCGYNDIQTRDEAVNAAKSEVINQYKRRADLVPMLVNTVKGYAAQEERVLREVTEARARVGQMQVTPETLNDPAALQRFQAVQGELSSALSRLMVVTENYPDLKSNENFRDLQAQLEGTENRIAVARNKYIQDVQAFNVLVRQFPTNLTAKMFGYPPKPNFTVANEAQITEPPQVDFSKPAQEPAPAPEKKPEGG